MVAKNLRKGKEMMDNNILILSVGRRVELVNLFRKAIQKYGSKGKVVGVDISATAPALYFCDKHYLIPRIDSSQYIEEILKICELENIALIIPTIDTELLKLAENRSYFEKKDIALNLSDYKVIDICRDKRKSNLWFQENDFLVPRTLEELDIFEFPLFIKPLDGSSSINTFKINNKYELEFFSQYVTSPIIQEFIDGVEYTVDVFCDLSSNPIYIVPRKRLAVRGGEILKGQIHKNKIIIEEIKKVISKLKPIGHITVQCIIQQDKVYFLEINPRYGGGAPMSIMAGADTPYMWLKILNHEKIEYSENYKDNVVFSRFDQSIEL